MYVLCLELLGKASEGQDAGYRGRETRGGGGGHVFGGGERELARVEIERTAEWNVSDMTHRNCETEESVCVGCCTL